jgi:hypothetical protein
MEKAFFAPVGRTVQVTDTNQKITIGEFAGMIQFAGVPAIYLERQNVDSTTTTIVFPITQVVSMDWLRPAEILIQR